ncbi:hypothetical protein [Undibacterium sp.]|uniref:hypothetical protein n=1 Tax=Undibacterium sp. TaxID=1914977 RepID=UPI0037508376
MLSPIADLLPVDFWGVVQNLFSSNSASSSTYYRIVPSESSQFFEFTTIGIGLLMVLIAWYVGSKRMKLEN